MFRGSLTASTQKVRADEFIKSGQFENAMTCYKELLKYDNNDAQTHLDIAKTYGYQNRFKEAIPHLHAYLEQNPEDLENTTFLGECYKKSGMFSKSIEYFEKVLKIEPKYDYARRNLLDAQNLYKQCIDPTKARKERYDYAVKNLSEAVKIAKKFFPRGYLDDMKDIVVSFDKTQAMGGRSNIAQYEHGKRKISVTEDYTYADPKLIGAYLIHEFVHGKDNDAYTSICEEQDAYRTQAQYWTKCVKNVYDPEMDYVAKLYKESAKTLDDRVAEIYKARDPNIAETSYNHPPSEKSGFFGKNLTKTPNTPLRAYEIIV